MGYSHSDYDQGRSWKASGASTGQAGPGIFRAGECGWQRYPNRGAAVGTSQPKCRLAKEGGFTVVVPSQPINQQAIKELLGGFSVKHLLDVNLLITGIVQTHSLHLRAHTWLRRKQIILCPLVELGFLRICTNHESGIGLTMERARNVLEEFSSERGADRIPTICRPWPAAATGSDQVTDHYLANLASQHGFKLATFDRNLSTRPPNLFPKPADARAGRARSIPHLTVRVVL